MKMLRNRWLVAISAMTLVISAIPARADDRYDNRHDDTYYNHEVIRHEVIAPVVPYTGPYNGRYDYHYDRYYQPNFFNHPVGWTRYEWDRMWH